MSLSNVCIQVRLVGGGVGADRALVGLFSGVGSGVVP